MVMPKVDIKGSFPMIFSGYELPRLMKHPRLKNKWFRLSDLTLIRYHSEAGH
ncbi:hypothetical protein BA6E_10827 [Bacteroidales bacterium 6E]|nr:hypothetical protein BA6E_10827 [Bacteroidales bacterium 6E]